MYIYKTKIVGPCEKNSDITGYKKIFFIYFL